MAGFVEYLYPPAGLSVDQVADMILGFVPVSLVDSMSGFVVCLLADVMSGFNESFLASLIYGLTVDLLVDLLVDSPLSLIADLSSPSLYWAQGLLFDVSKIPQCAHFAQNVQF